MRPLRHRSRGFGLLEVVLAAGVLSLVVGASTALIRSSLRRTTLAAERSVAMNLAQESIELLRSGRDSSYIDGQVNDWSGFGVTAGGALPPSACEGGLQYDAGCAQASYTVTPPTSAGAPWSITRGVESVPLNGTDYSREVYVTLPPASLVQTLGLPSGVASADVIRKVHVVVRWGGNTQAVESISYLTNWRTGI